MIIIHSKILAQFVAQVCAAFGISRGSYHPITIETSEQMTTLRTSNGTTSIACSMMGGGGQSSVTLALRDLVGLKSPHRSVEIKTVRDKVRVDVWQAGELHSRLCNPIETLPLVPDPDWKVSNPRSLGQVMRQAAMLTDPDSARLSLGCVRLRGNDGQIAATDGRQAFVRSGFNLPVDEVLVPAGALAQLTFLDKCTSMSVGRSEQWLTVECRSGGIGWRVDLRLSAQGRFPPVDQCMQKCGSSRCRIIVAERDAQYLLTHLETMLCDSPERQTMTLETPSHSTKPVTLRLYTHGAEALSGQAAAPYQVRSDGSTLTEIVLSGSSSTSVAMRVTMHPRYLLTALRLGYREIYLQSESFPAFCCDQSSQYTWALTASDMPLQSVPGMLELAT